MNAPPPPLYASRPDAAYSVVREIESTGIARSNAVQFTLKGQFAPRSNGSVQYTLSKAMNNTSGVNWMPPNSYDMSLEYARADFDQRHRFDFIGTFNSGSWANLGVALGALCGPAVLGDDRSRRLQHRHRECTSGRRGAEQPEGPATPTSMCAGPVS